MWHIFASYSQDGFQLGAGIRRRVDKYSKLTKTTNPGRYSPARSSCVKIKGCLRWSVVTPPPVDRSVPPPPPPPPLEPGAVALYIHTAGKNSPLLRRRWPDTELTDTGKTRHKVTHVRASSIWLTKLVVRHDSGEHNLTLLSLVSVRQVALRSPLPSATSSSLFSLYCTTEKKNNLHRAGKRSNIQILERKWCLEIRL